MKFVVKLKPVHDKTGLSYYAVSKLSGVVINTVKKYSAADRLEAHRFDISVVKLCRFYGVDWRDPQYVEIMEDGEEEADVDEETKTLLAA